MTANRILLVIGMATMAVGGVLICAMAGAR
jgi:hypothetical protein